MTPQDALNKMLQMTMLAPVPHAQALQLYQVLKMALDSISENQEPKKEPGE